MRISENTIVNPYISSLQDIQDKMNKEQLRLSSGKEILSLADSPKGVISVKQFSDMIDRNSTYSNNIDSATNELQSVSDVLEAMGSKVENVRQYAIDSSQTSNSDILTTLAVNVKGLLEDIVKDSNTDFKGHFLFSGTMTTSDSLSTGIAGADNQPFEITTTNPSQNNPSGLAVIFKGNNNDRIINKDAHTTEVINTKAVDIFGTNGTELFNNIIGLYNTLEYRTDGTKRGSNDTLTKVDMANIDNYQKNIEQYSQMINTAAAKAGSKLNRFDALKEQLTNENVILNDFRSKIDDTDVAQTSINLAKDQTALQYSLQVGSKLMQKTLFDFLT